MKERGFRVAVVTAWPSEDWHSARVLRAVSQVAEAVAIDPAALSISMAGGEIGIKVGDEAAEGYDAFILVRGLSPRGDGDVQFMIYRALEDMGVVVVNRIGPLLDAQDKFRTSFLLRRAGVPTPRAAVAQSPDEAAAIVREMGETVLKPLSASLGEGVERAVGEEGAQRAAGRAAVEGAIYVQGWVPNPGRDVRVFVVGGRAVIAVERLASPGEFRTNIARGAFARATELTPALRQIAERAASVLQLDYSGVDVIDTPSGPQVIEVNGNPSFDMIYEATGEDMAGEIAGHVIERARQTRSLRERRREASHGSPAGVLEL